MEKQKKLKEVLAEIDAMFPAIPEFTRVFKQYELDIRWYNRYIWSEHTTKEILIEKYKALLKIAQHLDHLDLLIFYYLDHIDGMGRETLLRMLKERYIAQCKFKNEFYNTDKYLDIGELGTTERFKNAKNPKKNLKNP